MLLDCADCLSAEQYERCVMKLFARAGRNDS